MDPVEKANSFASDVFLFFWCTGFWVGDKVIVHAHKIIVHALFIGLTSTLFRKKYIKNGSHGTIHTFKNYFTTVFSIFSKISYIQTDHKRMWIKKDKNKGRWKERERMILI